MRKVFVGGLPWEADENAVHQTFESFGVIEQVKIIRDRETGQSRGFGFVTFADEDGASAAIAAQSVEMDGRTCNIQEANEQDRRGRRRNR